MDKYKYVTLCFDVTFINGNKFLLNVCYNLDFICHSPVCLEKEIQCLHIGLIELVYNIYAKLRSFVTII